MANYITEELIQYMYSKTPGKKAQVIEKDLPLNIIMHEQIDDLQYLTQALDELLESPRPQSVMAILNYAKRTAVIND